MGLDNENNPEHRTVTRSIRRKLNEGDFEGFYNWRKKKIQEWQLKTIRVGKLLSLIGKQDKKLQPLGEEILKQDIIKEYNYKIKALKGTEKRQMKEDTFSGKG